MLDDNINANSTTSNNNKKEVKVEEKAEKTEVKEKINTESKTVDNYKANAEKINVDDIFKDLNINEFIDKGKNAKSRDDDGEER